MKPTLSIGFVGGAPNSAAGYAHFSAVRMDNLWSLEAGCFSRNQPMNVEAAQTYGVSPDKAYPDLATMLKEENKRLDAVAILTPTPLHYTMAIDCLKAGIPVICEKALAMTSTEAIEIEAVRAANNGFLAVIYNYSGYPMVRELQRMISEGILGNILHFQAEMPQEGFLRTDDKGNKPVPQEWRQKDGPVPTIHLDLAVHLHELIHYLIGKRPTKVISVQSSRGWFDVIDNVMCMVCYEGEVQGQFWFSKCALGHRNGLRLRIYGSKASVEWEQINPEELIVSYTDGRREIFDRASNATVASARRYTRFKAGHPAGFIEALANLYGDIHTDLLQFQENGSSCSKEVFGTSLAIDGLQWLEALVRSSKSEQWEMI